MTTERVQLLVDVDTDGELHLSIRSACDYAWVVVEHKLAEMNAPEHEDGSPGPRVSPCCRAKLYAALVGAIVEQGIRDLVSSGMPEGEATGRIADPLPQVKTYLNARHPRAPKAIGVA